MSRSKVFHWPVLLLRSLAQLLTENSCPEMEHLWLEILGRNKYSKAVVGVIYNSERILNPSSWLDSLESLLDHLTVSWDGMLILTGDVNIDILSPLHYLTKRYQTILYVFGLTQVVTHPTRITKTAKALIDHLIKNYPQKVTDSKWSRRHLRLYQCPFAPLSTVA